VLVPPDYVTMESLVTIPNRDDPIVVPMPATIPPTPVDPDVLVAEATLPPDDLAPVNARYIWFMVLAQFGVFMAFITPIAISLAVRLGELAPDNQEYLGYITGAGALWVMLTAPFMGIWSDRTRTRIGRRRPFMIGGMVVGVLSLFVMALAPSVLVLGAGWILAQWGWGTVLANLQNSTADRLPESQRGKVAGLTGFATQVAPVIGVIATIGVTGNALLLFLIPGIVGVVLVTLFVTLVH
jgi:MFS family permease